MRLDLLQTVALAGLLLFAGYGLKRLIPVLARYNIPAPVAGGLPVAAILALVRDQDLRRRAEETCWAWLRSAFEEGDLSGLSPEDVRIEFERCALIFDHGQLDHPFVETRLGLYVTDPTGVHFRDLRPIGHYRLITLLDGTDDDDYFVLDDPRQGRPDTEHGPSSR